MNFLIPHDIKTALSDPSIRRGSARSLRQVQNTAWFLPRLLILDTFTPTKTKGGADEPSTSIDEYEIPKELSKDIRARLAKDLEDLCVKRWG